ncbi:hypothetical protein DVN59_24625 [Escherichia coli]|nr:hypothetical protein [Escherichia coli]
MNRHSSDLIELLAQISRSHNAMSVSFSGDSSASGEEDRRKKDPPAKTLGMNSFRYSDCWRVKFLMN